MTKVNNLFTCLGTKPNLNDLQCNKMTLMSYVGNEDPDQPAHLCILTRAFIACSQNQWIM